MSKPYNLFAQCKSALRKLWLKSPMRSQAIKDARVSRGKYKCAKCGEIIKAKEGQVDHVNPVVPIGINSCDLSWDDYINNLFCDISNLKFLCKPCHAKKSKEERQQRNANKTVQ